MTNTVDEKKAWDGDAFEKRAWKIASDVYSAHLARHADALADWRGIDRQALGEWIVGDIADRVMTLWHLQDEVIPVRVAEIALMEFAGAALVDQVVQVMVGREAEMDGVDNGITAGGLAAWLAGFDPEARVVLAHHTANGGLWRYLNELPIKQYASAWFNSDEPGDAEFPVIEIDCVAAGLRVELAG